MWKILPDYKRKKYINANRPENYVIMLQVKRENFRCGLVNLTSQVMTQTLIQRCWENGKAKKLYIHDMKYYDLYTDSHNGSFLIRKNN